MGFWYACTVDRNVPDHPSCTMFANCAAAEPADRTSGDQEGHRVAAAAPPGCEWTVSVALHSWAFLLVLPLAARPGAVTPAASLAFLSRFGGPGCVLARAPPRPSVGRQEPSLRRLPASAAAGPGPAEPAIGFGEAVPVRRVVHRDSEARPAKSWSSRRAVLRAHQLIIRCRTSAVARMLTR